MCSEWLSFIISTPWEVSLQLPQDVKFSTRRCCDNFLSFLFRVNTNPHAGISLCLCTVVISREQRSNSVNPRSTCAHCLQAVCGSASLSYLGRRCCKSNPRQSQNKQTKSNSVDSFDHSRHFQFNIQHLVYSRIYYLHSTLLKTHQKKQKLENFE